MATFKPIDVAELTKAAAQVAPGTETVKTLNRSLSVTIAQMGFAPADLAQVPAVVKSLSVGDLEDFAKKMAGLPTENATVAKLTIQDIQGIEFLFASEKTAILHRLASQVGTNGLSAVARGVHHGVNVSCCCCTPCCCCAATEVEPFAA